MQPFLMCMISKHYPYVISVEKKVRMFLISKMREKVRYDIYLKKRTH